ncbi:MAG: hypothetical protein QXE64_01540 [Candidatus Pacearchaeota archaeon]
MKINKKSEQKSEKSEKSKKKKVKFWKIPPRIKVLEAAGAIADKRIKIKEKNKLTVAGCISSLGDKVYEVVYDKSKNAIKSNDNGSLFKGYLGYPSIALLMLEKVLGFDEKLSNALKGIPWKVLNEKFKNYFKTELVVKQILRKKGIDEKSLDKFIEKVLAEIKAKKFKVLE